MYRTFFAVIVLASTLQFSEGADRRVDETNLPASPVTASGLNAEENSPSHPEIQSTPAASDTTHTNKTAPGAPVNAQEPASSSTAAGAADFQEPVTTRNPWLYIIIGFLLVTGIFLYVDPKLF